MIKPPSPYWQDLTTEDFRSLDADKVTALLPVAAVEQHGPHLPVWVDACICQGVVARALELLDDEVTVLVLPMLPVGLSAEHADFPGTLSLSAETLVRAWTEVGEGVAATGIRKLAIVNSHGGQPQILDLVAQELRRRQRMLVFKINVYRFFRDAELFSEAEIRHGIHGGAIETSIMLHLRPDLVREDRIDAFTPLSVTLEEDYESLGPAANIGFAWQIQDLHAAGACGDATAADAEKGRALVDRAAARLAAALGDIDRMSPEILAEGK